MEQKMIPYFCHEGDMARAERTIKRLWILCILLVILLVGTNIAWIHYENQFTDEVTVTQDSKSGYCNYLGGDGVITNDKIRSAGGKLSGEDLTYLDKLTHTLKSLKTTIAMMEAEDGGESGRYMPGYGMYRNSYNGGNSYRRGRDSIGRYTSRRGGYSYDDGMIEELRSLMENAPDERTKSEFRQFIAKMEKM